MKMICYAWVMLAILCMISCHTLPDPVEKVEHQCLPLLKTGKLAYAAKKIHSRAGGSTTSIVPLMSNKEALESRLALIDSAQRSLEIQIFIWMNDYTGKLIMERVLMAADRGVKVRLLIDDLLLGISYTDSELAAIASHPNIGLRLYNPNKLRDRILPRTLDLVLNTKRCNQRMHNKSIVADGLLAILTGRNIGDHYFGYGQGYNMVDFGAMFAGSIVTDIKKGFNRYWNSDPTYDARAFIRDGKSLSLDKFRSVSRREILRAETAPNHQISITPQDWSRWFSDTAKRAYGGRAVYLEDAPENPSYSRPVIKEILRQCESSCKEIYMVTPYLVPDERMMAMLSKARSRGVRVVLLVPTVSSNNHLIVHNQYQKYRKILLRMGVEIYEFKHCPSSNMKYYINEGGSSTRKVGLHVKLVLIDSSITYMGSMNFDGRAMFVNTEGGATVRSKALALELKKWVNLLCNPENSWRLSLTKNGSIRWLAGEEIRKSEPALDFLQGTLEFIFRPFSFRHEIFPDRRQH